MTTNYRKEFEFNTGRRYRADGQLIKCYYDWSQEKKCFIIYFNDTARGIDGWMQYTGPSDNLRYMQDAVIQAYDGFVYAHGKPTDKYE